VSDQFRSQTVALNGIGVAPPGVSLSPISSLTFPATPVGTSAVAQTVTLTNNGGLPLNIARVALTGDFGLIAVGSTCGSTLAVSSSCTMQIGFTPTVGGPRNGTLTVTDNAVNSPQTLALSGTGVDFTLTPDGNTSVTVANGSSAVFPLLLSSAANVSGTVALTCAGVPANAKCNISPASVALGGATTVSVTIQTQVTVAAIRTHNPLLWLACLVPFGFLWRRWRLSSALLTLCLLAGCGAARTIPTTGGDPGTTGPLTPSGTYNIVVSGTSASLVRTVNLTLVVE
jgi:hypothetical protein